MLNLEKTCLNKKLSQEGIPRFLASEVQFGKCLGQGASARVYCGTLSGQEVAIKIFKDTEEFSLDLFLKETQLMASVPHPNIVLCLGYINDADQTGIITEFLSSGDLEGLIERKRQELKGADAPSLDSFWDQAIQYAIDVARGMAWLSQRGIIHRDLKPGNVLLDKHCNCKISDFGVSTKRMREKCSGSSGPLSLAKEDKGIAGSIMYMSPEALNSPSDTSTKADVYSFGILLWELLTLQKLDFNPLSNDPAKRKPNLDLVAFEIFRTIIASCLLHDPSKRPDFEDLVKILQTARIDFNLPLPKFSAANAFWKSYFLATPRVSFTEFVSKLALHLGEDEYDELENERPFASLLKQKFFPEDDDIGMVELKNLIHWLGPLVSPRQGEIDPSRRNLLCRLEALGKQPWFYGAIETEVASQLVTENCDLSQASANGTFLVRLNNGRRKSLPIATKPFKITFVHEQELHHTALSVPESSSTPRRNSGNRTNSNICPLEQRQQQQRWSSL